MALLCSLTAAKPTGSKAIPFLKAVPSHAITARSDGGAHAEDEADAMADESDSDTDGPVSEAEARRATACAAYARSVLGLLEESRVPTD